MKEKTPISEKNLERRLVAYAKALGVETIKLESKNNRGQPDRMFLHQGRVIFMEMKTTGKKGTALQLKYIEKLREQGFVANVVDTFNQGMIMLNNLYNYKVY